MKGLGAGGEGIGVIVLDGSTPYVMGQIFHSILTVPSYRDALLDNANHFVITFSNKPNSDTWQRNLLDRYRKELYWDPAKRVEIQINVDGALIELGIVSKNYLTGFKNFNNLENMLTKRLSQNDIPASAEVISITGALFPFMQDFNPREYVQSDYPLEPGDKQWAEQRSFGRKVVAQYDLNVNKAYESMLDINSIVRLVELTVTGHGVYQFDVYTDVGDGVVVVSDFKLGSLIVIWDGREHIDLNLFLFDDTDTKAKEFFGEFSKLAGKKLKIGLRDDFPRGIGRVMNFREDMTYNGFDSIWDLEPYVDQENEENED